MKVNFNNANTPLSSVQNVAAQTIAQNSAHANPAFEYVSFKGAPKESLYKRFENKVLDKVFSFKFVPKDKVLSEKVSNRFNKLGEWTTYHNRAIIGAFAFATQPWIDLFNPNVDDETKKMSFIRTMAKILVGTATGVAVRYLSIKGMEKLSKTGEELAKTKNKKLATLIMPTKNNYSELLTKSASLMSQHRKVIGTFIALGVMMITDPPLTIFMTNFFNGKKKQLEQKNALKAGKAELQNNVAEKEVKNA